MWESGGGITCPSGIVFAIGALLEFSDAPVLARRPQAVRCYTPTQNKLELLLWAHEVVYLLYSPVSVSEIVLPRRYSSCTYRYIVP